MTSSWPYALACIVVPCLMGLAMYGVTELWDRRRKRTRPDAPLPVIDYMI